MRSRRPGGPRDAGVRGRRPWSFAAFRHFDNRDGFPLLHDHCLVLNRVQRLDEDGEPVWGALDTGRLYRHVVAAGTLYTLAMTTEVCEELGLATVPREVTPGLRPVMEIAGVDSELIDWSSTRRHTRRSTGGCPASAPARAWPGGRRRRPAPRRRPRAR
nr:relaxase domain-containing protein [Streptomyces sp. SID5476]